MSKIDKAPVEVKEYIANAQAFGQSVREISDALLNEFDYKVSMPTLRAYISNLDVTHEYTDGEPIDLSIYEDSNPIQVLKDARQTTVYVVNEKIKAYAQGKTSFPRAEISALKVLNETLDKWNIHR